MRHCGLDSDEECFYVFILGKALLFSNCCSEPVLFCFKKASRSVVAYCVGDSCPEQKIAEEYLSDQIYTTIFLVQDQNNIRHMDSERQIIQECSGLSDPTESEVIFETYRGRVR